MLSKKCSGHPVSSSKTTGLAALGRLVVEALGGDWGHGDDEVL
jgi:hypothetical protein